MTRITAPALPGHATRAPTKQSLLAWAMAHGEPLAPAPGQTHPPRAFCGLGVCFECEALVDGRVVRTCLEPAP